MIYILDSNILIQAKNFYYAMDICPGFWELLDEMFADGRASSVKSVYREIRAGNDELADWVTDRAAYFDNEDDVETQSAYGQVAALVMAGDYNERSRDNFLDKADSWVIAKAIATGAKVVTHESRVNDNCKKVKIPNICKELGVECVDTFQFLRETNSSF